MFHSSFFFPHISLHVNENGQRLKMLRGINRSGPWHSFPPGAYNLATKEQSLKYGPPISDELTDDIAETNEPVVSSEVRFRTHALSML